MTQELKDKVTQEVEQSKSQDIAKNLLKNGMKVEDVSLNTGLSIENIKRLEIE